MLEGIKVTEEYAYDLGVLIGRFQPFHDGHLALLRQALSQAQHVLVIVGSAHAARRPDTLPFTAPERQAMIAACLSEAERARVGFRALRDLADDVLWPEAVREAVADHCAERRLAPAAKVSLFGCRKDASSHYLDAFPGWSLESVPLQAEGLSATDLRERYFAADPAAVEAFLADLDLPLPAPVRDWLIGFMRTPSYRDMVDEWAFVGEYRRRWEAAPYPPTFVTADAVVIHRGEVLLIQRARRPGQGLWALPGGFLDGDEYLRDAALRELAEETSISLPPARWRRELGTARVFDAPRRDIRGRTVTHAFLVHLSSNEPRPMARPADDAAEARWTALADLDSEVLYGDHYQIIRAFERQLSRAEV